MDALTSLLHEDATQSMPPYDLWLRGRDDILAGGSAPAPTAAALGWSPRRPRTARRRSGSTSPARPGGYDPWALQVLEVSDGRIVELTFFLDTDSLFPLFGLPARLDS